MLQIIIRHVLLSLLKPDYVMTSELTYCFRRQSHGCGFSLVGELGVDLAHLEEQTKAADD